MARKHFRARPGRVYALVQTCRALHPNRSDVCARPAGHGGRHRGFVGGVLVDWVNKPRDEKAT